MSDVLDEEQTRAVRRWKLGHHAFHLYLTAMNGALDGARKELGARHWEELQALFGELRSLYQAATAAMKYAASFRATTYETLIRPSMSEQMMSPGFSGALNRDHEVMLGLLRSLKKEFRQSEHVPPTVDRAWRALMSAQARNRREHVLICGKFVEGGQSLLATHFAKAEEHEDDGARP